MKKTLFTIAITLLCFSNLFGQNNEILAKSYFIKAQEFYGNGNSKSALINLNKCVENLGATNPKIEAMYVRLKTSRYLSLERKIHLDNYFKDAKENHSDYMEMLELAVSVNENAVANKEMIEETEKQSVTIKPLWDKAKKDNTIEAYEIFIESTNKFSHNKFKNEANSNIEKLRKELTKSFSGIETIAVFEGCEGNNAELKMCFNKKIQQYFSDEFDSTLPNSLEFNSGKYRVMASFEIDQNGFVKRVSVRAPHPVIKKEVIRVLESLPKMKPGKQNGQNVIMTYSTLFSIQVD